VAETKWPGGKQFATITFGFEWRQAGQSFDLISVLPQLLPSAVAWMQAQSHRASETGDPLDAMSVALAERVGVLHP
jgi:hypothetical protein